MHLQTCSPVDEVDSQAGVGDSPADGVNSQVGVGESAPADGVRPQVCVHVWGIFSSRKDGGFSCFVPAGQQLFSTGKRERLGLGVRIQLVLGFSLTNYTLCQT